MNKKQSCSPAACEISCASSQEPLPNSLKLNSSEEPESHLPAEDGESSPESVGPGRKRRSIIFHLMYALDAHDYEASLESIIDTFNRGFEQTIELNGEEYKACQALL